MGHTAVSVMSAVFAIAENRKHQVRILLLQLMQGYEVCNRVAAAAQPGLAHRGFHSTGTAGALGAAAVCAKLMKLNEKEIYSAISLAAVQSSGLILVSESGQCCKPINRLMQQNRSFFCKISRAWYRHSKKTTRE